MVPLLSLKTLNATMQQEIEAAVLRVVRSGWYILGEELEAFEREWAAYCGAKYCVGTGNALDALTMTLKALGVAPGDEVIVPSNTYIATWLAVSRCGARPVPVEPDPKTFNISPAAIRSEITWRTAAIMPVHLYGRCAEMDEINAIADDARLPVVCDAAHAHGATYKGRRAGALSTAEAFSFYPSKNLGAMGDAGCVVTNDERIANMVRRLRHYGGVGRVDHQIRGINSRLDEIQAAVLRVKLKHLETLNAARRSVARFYNERLPSDKLLLPELLDGNVWHQYVVRSERRELLIERLKSLEVEAHIHYPQPPHLEGAYASLGFGEGSFPIAERLAREVFSLPIGYAFPLSYVVDSVREAAKDA